MFLFPRLCDNSTRQISTYLSCFAQFRKLRQGQEEEEYDLLWRGWVQTDILTSALAQEGARTDWSPRSWPVSVQRGFPEGWGRCSAVIRSRESHTCTFIPKYSALATKMHFPNRPTTLSKSCVKTTVRSCLCEWLMLWTCTHRQGLINIFKWWWFSNASPNFNEFANPISFYLSVSPRGLSCAVSLKMCFALDLCFGAG